MRQFVCGCAAQAEHCAYFPDADEALSRHRRPFSVGRDWQPIGALFRAWRRGACWNRSDSSATLAFEQLKCFIDAK